jgi:AraC-like DNA-binding protein
MLRNRYPQADRRFILPQALYEALQRILEQAPQHLGDWTAKDAAAFGNLSYSYFSRNFKLAYGISFTAYLESLRLQEGERLLLTTDKEVTEISADLGFATTSYFIERFRKRYGTSPGAFRAQMKKK